MGQGEDSSGQGDALQRDPAWPWQPPAEETVERSQGWYRHIAVLSGVTAALSIWAAIVRAGRGDSWLILLPTSFTAVLWIVMAAKWTIRWRRHPARQRS